MKVAILYHSQHQENTMKVLEAIKGNYKVELIDITEKNFKNMATYDLIGIASGLYDEMSNELVDYVKANVKNGKKFFIISNSAAEKDMYAQDIEKMISEKNGKLLGKYAENSYPSDVEFSGAVDFYRGIIREQRNNCLC